MITASVVALALAFSASTLAPDPPARPSGSIGVGHGMELLDTSFNDTPRPVSDPSLPGGMRATLRYLWWSVYVQPTGNVEMRTSLTCTHKCENPGQHWHGPQCTIGGCAIECPYDGHKTTLTATSSSSTTSAVSQALTRANASVRSVTANMGVSAGPFSAGVSATASESSSSSATLGSSISNAVGRSVSGSTEISLDHFNTKPCTTETWFFGTKEYEVRMILQVFEQDYYSESWVIGGQHGMLPGSGLRLAGEARFVGAPQDVQLGTYQVPTNEPVKKQSDPDCGCKPKPVITPSGGDRKHSSLPSGTSKFYVTLAEDERVFFTNPTNEPVIVSYAGFVVEVQPDEEKEIERGDTTDPLPILVTTAAGDPMLQGLRRIMLPTLLTYTPTVGFSYPWKGYEADVSAHSGSSKGKVEATHKIGEGENAVVAPDIADEVLAPQIPQPITLLEIMISAGITTSSVPVMNGRTPVLEFRGDIPDGATFSIESGETKSFGDIFLKIKGVDGETRAAFVKFDGINGESQSNPPPAKLICRKAGGEVVSELDITFHLPAVQSSITPTSGPAGSAATLIIDTREVMALMALSSGAHALQFDLVLSYAASGGATGPERVWMDPSGITRIPVRRGSVPGGFQVAISMDYHNPEWTDHNDHDPGKSSKSDPGVGIRVGG